MKYIKAMGNTHDEGCIFCTKPAQQKDRENFILHRGKSVFVIMNIFPYNNGHLMVVPYQHTSDITSIDTACGQELFSVVGVCTQALHAAMNPEGFNVGMNIGRTAGAGIDQHLHMHIVPRWNGDTSFFTVIGDSKVISQSLEDAYDSLLPHFVARLGTTLQD
jgi:ATP adenylyltransferase